MKRNRKKVSVFDRACDSVFNWAAGKLICTIPVLGPIYSIVSLVNDVASIEKEILNRK
jgi:hypothetical protein